MEKNRLEKTGSFAGRNDIHKNETFTPRSSHSPMANEKSNGYHQRGNNDHINREHSRENSLSDQDHNIDLVSEEVDQFTNSLSTVEDKSKPPEVPDAVDTFIKILESRMARYNSGMKAGKLTEEDSFFLEAVKRISKLAEAFSEFHSNSTTSSSLNRTSMVLQRAMTFLEDEFRSLLEDFRRPNILNMKILSSKQSSMNKKPEECDRCSLPDPETNDEEEYSPEVVTKMNRIATVMITAGYITECCQVYTNARRNAFNEEMKKLEFEKINMEDVQKMTWDSLEGEVARWIKVVKHCSNVLFPGEHKLDESVFSDSPTTCRGLFSNLARTIVIQLLDFAEAVAMTKRSAEKLFKFLDIYESLRELIPSITASCSDDCEHELKSEINATCDRIGEAAVNIFCDLENSIKSDVAKTPVPGGAVHPLTRYVMNYLKYACEYKDTLELIFRQHAKLEQNHSLDNFKAENETESPHHDKAAADTSPFSVQLMMVMDLLDTNLEAKSGLYKDTSLRYVFLMNNGRYILQKVKGSSEIHQAMGDNWCRRRSTVVRQFHKNYQRETWGKMLQCLGHAGLQVNNKVNKSVLKERFKNFSMMFDEIHKAQSTWVVSDEQLQSELRVSISAVVIPAYRSFIGRFRQYLDSGRQAEKYIKYQPEDIETMIEGLFDGNPMSMGRRRT